MAHRFEVVFRDRTFELVDADAYQQEGPMTSFFALGEGRDVVDAWSRRVASVRTADLLMVRQVATATSDGILRAVV